MTRLMTRLVLSAATALLAAAVVSAAVPQADPFTGTWTLNAAKSKYNPGPAPKSGTVTFSMAGANARVVVDGISGTGEKTHWEYTAAFDGKDHPMKGNPDGDTVVLKKISASSVEITYKKAGKPTVVNVRTVSSDGKTLTVTTKGTNAQGQKVDNVQVFEKKM